MIIYISYSFKRYDSLLLERIRINFKVIPKYNLHIVRVLIQIPITTVVFLNGLHH